MVLGELSAAVSTGLATTKVGTQKWERAVNPC